MASSHFFDEQTEQSEVKTELVSKYFWAWAKVMIRGLKKPNGRIGYVDLFAGPGRYRDGSKSTPVRILESAIRNPEIGRVLVARFNDKDGDNSEKLRSEIESLDGIDRLPVRPIVTNRQVDDELAKDLTEYGRIPSLFFLDPWGYKGLSLNLVKSAIIAWGCDCIFFFNYNRINAALSNPVMRRNMDAFFGTDRAVKLRDDLLEKKSPNERERIIISNLKEALAEMGGKYSQEYFFKANGKRTSHFIVFVSKHPLGLKIMKDIMAGESSEVVDGVANFGHEGTKIIQPSLFLFSEIDELKGELVKKFAGRVLTVRELFYEHSPGTKFVLRNYQDAIRRLEQERHVICNPSSSERPLAKGVSTMSESVIVEFLEREQ